MEIIGHRGCADQVPENTVSGVKRASRHLDAVEVDIRRCGSGELVVFHDETVDRLTDGTGRVADLSLSALQSLEVMDSGESVPRLESVLDALPAGTRVQLELKDTGIAADTQRVVEGRDLDVTVSSFRASALAAVRRRDWDVPTGYLFETDPWSNIEVARTLRCEAVHPHYDLCLETDVVEAAHEAGLQVVAWKAARTEAEVTALRDVGVDGVTADRWDIV